MDLINTINSRYSVSSTTIQTIKQVQETGKLEEINPELLKNDSMEFSNSIQINETEAVSEHLSNKTGKLGLAGEIDGGYFILFSGTPKTKEVSYDFVPDKLWDAFISTENINKYGDSYLYYFDKPKYNVDLTAAPPTLEKLEVDEEKMLSYDYISHINRDLNNLKRIYENSDDKAEIAENIQFLQSLKENLSEVLNDELSLNNGGNDFFYRASSNGRGTPWSYDDVIRAAYQNTIASFSYNTLNSTRDKVFEEAGIPLEYVSQVTDQIRDEVYGEVLPKLKEFLETTNSNINGEWDPQTELEKNIDLEWFEEYIVELYSTIIDSMGKIDEPGNKWMDPELYDLKKAVEKGQK